MPPHGHDTCHQCDQSGAPMPRGTIERTRVRTPTALLVHPFELAFAALFTLIGAGLLARGGEVRVSSIQTLPEPLVVCWEIFLLAGGPSVAFGLLWRGTPMMGRAIETAGLCLAAAAWSTYAVTMWAVLGAPATIPSGEGVTIALACLLRAYALLRVEKVIAKVNAAPAPDVTR